MIRTVLFDWDGTLHNTEALYGNAFRRAYRWLVQEGWAPPREYADGEVSRFLGLSAPEMWKAFMPELPDPVWQHASGLVGQGMVEGIENGQAILYDGALDALQALRDAGYTPVFLSACRHSYMEAHRRCFDLDRYFAAFYCSGDYDFRLKKDIFPLIRERFPGEYVMVGDRSSDMEVALTHGLRAVGCAYGFGQSEELTGADRIIEDIRTLPGVIKELDRA